MSFIQIRYHLENSTSFLIIYMRNNMFMMMLLIEVVIKNYYYTVENKGNSKTIRAGKRLRIYSSDESSQEQ